jgi:hypothetical protein
MASIRHIRTRLGGQQQGRHLISGGVVGMQVDRDARARPSEWTQAFFAA